MTTQITAPGRVSYFASNGPTAPRSPSKDDFASLLQPANELPYQRSDRAYGFNELGLFGKRGGENGGSASSSFPAPSLIADPDLGKNHVIEEKVGSALQGVSACGSGGYPSTPVLDSRADFQIASESTEALDPVGQTTNISVATTERSTSAFRQRDVASLLEDRLKSAPWSNRLIQSYRTDPQSLTLRIDGSTAEIIIRAYSLSSDDRTRLRDRLEDILGDNALSLSHFIFNGVDAEQPSLSVQGRRYGGF